MRRLQILSPVAGLRHEVSEVPDPVFAQGLVGPGAALTPYGGVQVALAPIDGVLTKLHPHAYLVVNGDGLGVLVHLGIDTVHLHGEGFTTLVEENADVTAGTAIVRWDPARVEKTGRSAICAVVVLDCPCPAEALQPSGSEVEAADPLFVIDCPPR